MTSHSFNDLCAEFSVIQEPVRSYNIYPRGGITTPSENNVKYHMDINKGDQAKIYSIDKGLLKNRRPKQNACDWLILIKETDCSHGCFVELKKGSGESVSQLPETFEQFQEKGWLQKISKRYARIVANSMPASASKRSIEKMKMYFKEYYQCELKHIRPGQKDKIIL